MTPDPMQALRLADPLDHGELDVAVARAARLRARIPATRPGRDRRRRRRGATAAVVAGSLALAGGGALAAIALDRGDAPFPDTAAGGADVRAFLAGMSPPAAVGGPSFQAVPGSARVVFSRPTPAGEYTIWRAGTRGRGTATVLSSPGGVSLASVGPGRRLPEAPFVRVLGGGASPVRGRAVREAFGRVSPDVARVAGIRRDGGLVPVMLDDGWFVLTQPFGHPEVVALVARDTSGRVVARTDRPVF